MKRRRCALWYCGRPRPADKYNIFIDEGPINLPIKRNCGWFRRGERTNLIIPALRGVNLIPWVPLVFEPVLLTHVIVGGAQAVDFRLFLRELKPEMEFYDLLEEGALFYDNAAIHLADLVRDFIDESALANESSCA